VSPERAYLNGETSVSAITTSVTRDEVPADRLKEVPWQGASVGFATWAGRGPLRAVAEVLVAIVLGGLTWWCWHRGVVFTATRRGIALYRIEGRWWAIAVGAATVAGILLLDAGRRMTAQASRQHYR